MTFMKNREKFAKEIMDIACSGSGIAMKGGVLVPCDGLRCIECDFSSLVRSMNNSSCSVSVEKWCESEYVEPPIDWSKIEVDTPIYVSDTTEGIWKNRYFAKYEDYQIYAWSGGRTSWSASDEIYYAEWRYAKLADKLHYND